MSRSDERPAAFAQAAALSPDEIEQKVEQVSVAKATMPLTRLVVLAVFAGMFIAFGASFFTAVTSDASLSFGVQRVLGALTFCVGLVMVLLCGAELFTGNSLMVIGVVSRKISLSGMLRNWAVVWIGNFAGSLIIAALLYLANTASLNGGAVGDAMVSIAAGKAALPWCTAFFRGVLCNILVCLAVWIGFGARSATDKVIGIILPISTFVVLGFEHCVANMFFLPMGLIAKAAGYGAAVAGAEALTPAAMALNLSAATLGNLLGGVVVVGLGYWAACGRKRAQ